MNQKHMIYISFKRRFYKLREKVVGETLSGFAQTLNVQETA